MKEKGIKPENVVQKMLLTCLDSVTIKDLISLDLITNLFFKPLPDYLAKGYRKSNNINIGAIRAREGLNFHYN